MNNCCERLKTENPFAIIEQSKTVRTGGFMGKKINIMDVNIDRCSAKEAMKKAVKCMNTDPVSVFEILTSDLLLQLAIVPEIKEKMAEFELLLAGELTLLNAAGITDKKYLQETENREFLKTFMRYLHKHHKRVYLVAETEEEVQDFKAYMHKFYGGAQLVGTIKVSSESRADDMVVNAINGSEADCVLSILSSPLQEEFIIKNRSLLNVHVWMNLGKEIIPVCRRKMKQNRFTQFIVKRILQKEIKKGNKNGGN